MPAKKKTGFIQPGLKHKEANKTINPFGRRWRFLNRELLDPDRHWWTTTNIRWHI